MLTDPPAPIRAPLPWKAIGIGLGLTAVLLILFLFASRYESAPSGTRQDAYAAHLAIENARVSQADTMLAGSVTYWNADLVNHGARTLTACTATLTFVDPYGRTVQIEKENLLDPKEPPLAPNASRHLQIGFDHISFQWNQAPPNVAFTRVYVRKASS